jgi:hypothetical protein
MKHAYDDETIPLTAQLGGGAATVGKIKESKFTVTVHANGTATPEAPATASVSGTPAKTRHNYKAKPVGDDADYYDLTYKVEVTPPGKPTLSKDGDDTIRVWPRKAAVKFTSDDGAGHKGVKFRLLQKGKATAVQANAEGAWSGTPLQAEFDIEVDSPWEITDKTKGKGPKREYKVKKSPYKAAFVSPDPDGKEAAIKQWVNLSLGKSRKWTKHEPFGRVVEFTVAAEGDSRREASARHGKAGDIIHILVEFDLASKRNSPKPQLLAAGLDGAPEELAGGKTFKGKVKLKSDGTAVFKVDLGLAGGDTCKVHVAAVPDGKEDTLSFENWRKLYYQLTVPKGMAPVIDKFTEAMKAAKIECEKYEEVQVALEDGPKGSWVDGAEFGREAGRKLVVGPQNSKYFHKLFNAAKKPLEAHFMFCHFQLDGTSSGGAPYTSQKSFDGDSNDKVTVPGSAEAPGFQVEAMRIFPGFKLFPTALHNGKPAVYEAKWKSNAVSGTHKGKKGNFPADCLIVNFKDFQADNGRLFALYPPDAVKVIDGGETISITISVYLAKGWYNGESVNHRLLIAGHRTKDDGVTIDWEGINGTMGHELGHAMNMAAADKLVIPGIEDVRAAHTRWYDSTRGHQGDHCAKGVAQDAYDDTSKMMKDYAGTCVMFGAGVAGRSHEFCDLCTPLVLGADLTDITK